MKRYQMLMLDRQFDNLDQMLKSYSPARRAMIVNIAHEVIVFLVKDAVAIQDVTFINKENASRLASALYHQWGEVRQADDPLVQYTASLALARIVRRIKEI